MVMMGLSLDGPGFDSTSPHRSRDGAGTTSETDCTDGVVTRGLKGRGAELDPRWSSKGVWAVAGGAMNKVLERQSASAFDSEGTWCIS